MCKMMFFLASLKQELCIQATACGNIRIHTNYANK